MNDNEYDPNIDDYDPLEHSCWKQGEKVSFLAFAKTLDKMEQESGRLKKVAILSNFFWSILKLSPEDLMPAIYLVTNRLAPDYEGVELGVGETLIMKAIAQCSARSVDQIKKELITKKDLGIVAETSVSKQSFLLKPKPLVLSNVFHKLRELAMLKGNSSQNQKVNTIHGMLAGSKGVESRFLVRLIGGKLSICFGEASLQAALAQAIALHESNIKRSSDKFKGHCSKVEDKIKTAYCQCPNFERILKVYFEQGLDAMEEQCSLTLGIPLKPMLAHAAKGMDEAFKKLGDSSFTCEFKYDGERAQVHFQRTEEGEGDSKRTVLDISIYSRNQENNTSKYPDIISRLNTIVDESVKSFILDAEAVAWDLKNKQILPFQILSTRKRKDAKENEITVQVCLFGFDLLHLNGESLIELSLRERRELLKKNFKEVEGEFFYAQSKDLQTADEVLVYFEESLKGKCEGLMIKTLDDDASYEIAKRSHKWLKLKKDYLEGLADTLDLVVIGGFYGKGKRSGNYGGYLLACYDEDNEEYQAICKLGTGFKDEDLEQQKKFFETHIVSKAKSYYNCDESIKPDVWFEPVQVWEVKCADISLSPVYRAAIGLVDDNKGISLRFPRFIRIREDKKPEMATNSAQVAEIYKNQEIFKSNDCEGEDD